MKVFQHVTAANVAWKPVPHGTETQPNQWDQQYRSWMHWPNPCLWQCCKKK